MGDFRWRCISKTMPHWSLSLRAIEYPAASTTTIVRLESGSTLPRPCRFHAPPTHLRDCIDPGKVLPMFPVRFVTYVPARSG